MSMDAIINLEEALGRKFTEQESARLREIGRQLHLRDDDALWSLLAALEYQRIFYEALPDRIADASREIMDGISAAAASETAAAQARLTESVVEQAERLSGKIHYATLVPLGIAALICLLVFGSLMLWAGFCIGSGQSLPPAALLNMPSGILIGGLSFVAGIYLFVITARLFIDEDDAWKNEREFVEKTGRGSRNWTPLEKDELLKNGKVKGYEGQHMKSANEYPDFAGDASNIQFLKRRTMDKN